MLDSLATWLAEHSGALTIIAVLSFLLLLASLLATPWILARLPENYFVLSPEPAPKTLARFLLSAVKTVLGLLLMLTGIIMFFTPGPGLVSLVLGIALCDFPGKQTALRRFVRLPSVFTSLNWLRAKAGKPPFLLPPADG